MTILGGSQSQRSPSCTAPWVALEFDPAGWVYACCASHLYPLGRIGEDRLADLWDGARARVLKEALTRGDMTVACASCRWHLERGRTDVDAAVYDEYSQTDGAGPRAMTFALSNRCNLGCVMCTPELSSTLRRRAGLPAIQSPYGKEFFDELAPFLEGLEYAKFLGGEPFLVEEHHVVWDLMSAGGSPPRIQVTTNGTVWSDRVRDVLDRFRTDVTISVDAVTPAAYESIRVGAEHALLMRNIDRFRRYCQSARTELRLCFCLMDRNWRELAPFLLWSEGLGAAVTVNLVSDRGLALHDLPTARLEAIRRSWDEQDAEIGVELVSTAHTWRTQLIQMDAVLEERRAGKTSSPRQAVEPSEGGDRWAFLNLDEQPRQKVAEERRRLGRWAGNRAIAVLNLDLDGRIRSVESELDHLGLTIEITGRHLGDLESILSEHDGRPCWLVDQAQVGDSLVHTLVLSASEPARGATGRVVRTVLVRAARGGVLMLAEDLIYERAEGTGVRLNSRR